MGIIDKDMYMKRICVVGAGTMGWSIGQVLAAAGYDVLLCDRELELAQKGKTAMENSLNLQKDKGKVTAEAVDLILNRIVPGDIKEAENCQMAIEAIYEEQRAKQDIFMKLEAIVPGTAILATNTSSLSITELASCLKEPSRLIGMHFFNPVPVMKLVEIIGGEKTADDCIRQVTEFAKSLGKTPVQVNEAPGFIVNRILIPMINEAVCVLAEGTASAEDIDTAMKLGANHPLGPLALGDMIGLDVCLAIMEVLQYETGDDKYRPHPLLRKMVRAGKLGRKAGAGFFTYFS